MSNSNYLIKINLCKNLFSLERFAAFGDPKIELLAKFVMELLKWSFL